MSGLVYTIEPGDYHLKPWNSSLLASLETSFEVPKNRGEALMLQCSDPIDKDVEQKITSGQIPVAQTEQNT